MQHKNLFLISKKSLVPLFRDGTVALFLCIYHKTSATKDELVNAKFTLFAPVRDKKVLSR